MATHWTLGCDAVDPPWDMVEREGLIREKVAVLVGAGATEVREESYDGALGHVVMLDPEGNEFCVARPVVYPRELRPRGRSRGALAARATLDSLRSLAADAAKIGRRG